MFRDFLDIGEGVVYPGEGNSCVPVRFRLVLFRPFVGEVIVATLLESTPTGVVLSTGFFHHISVPADEMPLYTDYVEEENQWRWNYLLDGEEHPMWLENGGRVRFRVTSISYQKESLKSKPQLDASVPLHSPMAIYGTICSPTRSYEAGLGMTSWWGDDVSEQTAPEGVKAGNIPENDITI
eukprot:TRINITY_DN5637_c0_g1_i4.p1 TRINITY_DN5637_c0_g1~~TRINITY_DN5637_c0_g1_i4.p1  ORF type:complete len:181 (-),score=24.74 TRINITY_DN5637_c0_g1_i4:461-1003(-)